MKVLFNTFINPVHLDGVFYFLKLLPEASTTEGSVSEYNLYSFLPSGVGIYDARRIGYTLKKKVQVTKYTYPQYIHSNYRSLPAVARYRFYISHTKPY